MYQRKGLDPLIATTLLLVFTLAISAVTINWISPFSKSQKEMSEKQGSELSECNGIALQIQKVYAGPSGKISKIDVQNTGAKTATLKELRIVGINSTCTFTFDQSNSTIAIGDARSILMQNCAVTCASYQSSTMETSCSQIRATHLRSGKVSGCAF